MVYFVNHELNGCTLIQDGIVHEFDGLSRKCINDNAEHSYRNIYGAIQVNVISVVRLSASSCELFCDCNGETKKIKLRLGISYVAMQLYKHSGYIIELTRDVKFNSKTFNQYLFVYPSTFNCINVATSVK